MEEKVVFKSGVCLECFLGRVRCAKPCALSFPDTPEHRKAAKLFLQQIEEHCVMKTFLKGKPRFVNPRELLKPIEKWPKSGQK